jgi:serine/threonine protein kinase/dienelactone hydrolase
MGIVYKAEDTKLKRSVALKFLPPELIQNEEIRERFVLEAQTAAALSHPNICTIHEIDEEEGKSFIAMEYVEGQSLKDRIGEGPLGIDEVLDIAIQVAEGLEEAHKKGIIHRDIKSANIMVTEKGQAKVMDFGLAKVKGATLLTREGTTLGTVAYMSPEQARGEEVDHRSDIWSLGIVLYEMLSGQLPFKGDREASILYSVVHEEPKPLKEIKRGLPLELQQIINRALKKRPESRYSSAAEIIKDLRKYQDVLRAEELGALNLRTLLRRIRKPQIAIPAVGLILVICFLAVWFFNRQANIRWAKEKALPEIERLIETNWRDFTGAYRLAEEAEEYIPNDSKLAELFSRCSLNINIKTEPSGAKIYMKEYKAPNSEWEFLGVSPIENIRLPVGIFRWKMEKEGYETVIAASSTWDISIGTKNPLIPNDLVRVLDEKGSIPEGTVRVPGAETDLGELDDFYIDKYEVTNKQYKEFVDNGGYRSSEYWEHEFIKDGRVLTWEEAMAEFVDQTSRPGPAIWQAGDYPEGQDDYPVSGISWYEAAAHAVFVGKSLPTGKHWGLARGEYTSLIRWPQLGGFAVFAPFSNFQGKGPVAVGSLPGITSYGAYDMAGNVREWCWNETSAGKLMRGGAWNDNPYRFTELAGAPPFDRSSRNGFRCALYPDPDKIPESAFAMTTFGETTDFYKEKPVSEAIFQVYKEQFLYDKTDLNVRLEARDESSEDWIYERITFDAAYGNERIIANLFLPKNTSPPYQTVVYFPGVASLFQSSSEDLNSYYEFPVFLSFIVKNGRAVLYPVYKGTFERRDDALIPIHGGDNSHLYTEYLIQMVKDFKRSIDYLETRQDIDSNKFAYYGMSWGGMLGAIIPAVEERLKATIILGGGLRGRGRPEANQINYITRVKTPTLMLHGKYDTIFPYETSIKPMFDLLGTADEHKELKLYETDHISPRNDFIKEILAWLDRYLGPVK